jgi:ketosteroid isomerase-like protein
MNLRLVFLLGIVALLQGCAHSPRHMDRATLVQELTITETAFAKTMADRDFIAFKRFIADDAVFLNGGKPLRGKTAIAAYWARLCQEPVAPFSWRPEFVEVLDSGRLGQTVGPVMDKDGTVIARFYSTWRREPSGGWRIVLDNGYDICKCTKP